MAIFALSPAADHYLNTRAWFSSYWRLEKKGNREKPIVFALSDVGAQRQEGGAEPARVDEAMRERRTDVINAQSKLYEKLAVKSDRLASVGQLEGKLRPGELSKVLATAANASAIIPLLPMLDSYERLAATHFHLASANPDFHLHTSSDLQFAHLVLSHVLHTTRAPSEASRFLGLQEGELRAGDPSIFHDVRTYLRLAVPHALEIYAFDYDQFVGGASIGFGTHDHRLPPSEGQRKRNREVLLAMVEEQVEGRRRAVSGWNPPYGEGVMVGACKPFGASMLDTYAVRRAYRDPRNHTGGPAPPPAYYQSPTQAAEPSLPRPAPAYHATARPARSETPQVLVRSPFFGGFR
ncbi:hypothetical protein JCM8547_005060 [Rhodosporidiobolus lusitaniae]